VETAALKTGVMAAVFIAAATGLVCAQGAPAVQPANPASPQPAAPATASPAPAPAAEAYTYDPSGRRDPFVSLLSRGMETAAGTKLTGLAGMTTGELMLRGILQSRNTYIALVSGPDGKTYPAHVNDRLLDGVIRSVTPQGIVIMQDVNDPLSLVKQREVRKGLRTADDGK
jgi:type IV pilus assembly protein PilP